MKVRASVLTRIGATRPYSVSRPLEVEELELDGPGPREVLLKVHAAGLCHSDLSAIDGTRPAERTPLPMILGHEAAGEVLEVGAGVTDLKPGDRVVTTFVPSCGHCVSCMEGRPALCEPAPRFSAGGVLATGGTRFRRGSRTIHHYVGVAGFAEMTVMVRDSLVKIDDDVAFESAALFGCAVLTGVGAVLNTARIRAGDSVAVIGLGGVGLSALLGARMAGAFPIVAVDPSDEKLRLALDLGASLAVRSDSPDAVARIRDSTEGGVHYAFETAGATQALDIAYRVTRRGGTTVVAGLPAGNLQAPFSHASLVAEERTVKGSYFGSCVPVRDLPRLIRAYRLGQLPVDRITGATVRLEEMNEAFDTLAAGTALRQVLVPA
ncbi:MAG: zinc-dependent alcohol dehydrogenase family protein [Burkholderiaceae bacterium]|nr:zinc-dependent alcohol dehydrogenase family protein [Burkholderiaceae bacterium]